MRVLPALLSLACIAFASAAAAETEQEKLAKERKEKKEQQKKDDLKWCNLRFSDPIKASPEGGGIALSISGGGFRAMLYHVGALKRLNDAGLLAEVEVVSSVSGGSIAAGMLAKAWKNLSFEKRKIGSDDVYVATNFRELVELPLYNFAGREIDVTAALGSLFPGKSAAQSVAEHYNSVELFDNAKLADFPPKARRAPREPVGMPYFIFNATNLQTGEQWQFRAVAMGGLVLGWTEPTEVRLADAVAASSAFPPFLSPLRVTKKAGEWHDCTPFILSREERTHALANENHTGRSTEDNTDGDKKIEAMREEISLTDGGVRDNLGLVAVVNINRKRSENGVRELDVLASDAGRSYEMKAEPPANWVGQTFRIVGILTNEPDLLRIEALVLRGRTRKERLDAERGKLCEVKPAPLDPVALKRWEREEKSPADWQHWRQDVCFKADAAYWSSERMPPEHQCALNKPEDEVWHAYDSQPAQFIEREHVRRVGRIQSRLLDMPTERRERLVNWGYLSTHYALPYLDRMWGADGEQPGMLNQCSNPLNENTCTLPYPDTGFLDREKTEDPEAAKKRIEAERKKLFPLMVRCP